MSKTFETQRNSEAGSKVVGASVHTRAGVHDDSCCATLAKFNERAAATYCACCDDCEYREMGDCRGNIEGVLSSADEKMDSKASTATVSLRKILTDVDKLVTYMKRLKELGAFESLGNSLRKLAQVSNDSAHRFDSAPSGAEQLAESLKKLKSLREGKYDDEEDWIKGLDADDVDTLLPVPDGYFDIETLLLEDLKEINREMKENGHPGMPKRLMKPWVSVAMNKLMQEFIMMFEEWAELCCETGRVVGFKEVFA